KRKVMSRVGKCRRQRRIRYLALGIAAAVLIGGGTVLAVKRRLHYEKVESYPIAYENEGEQIEYEEESIGGVVKVEKGELIETEKTEEIAPESETESESETEPEIKARTIALKLAYLPHEPSPKGTYITFADRMKFLGKAEESALPEEEQQNLYLEIDDLYYDLTRDAALWVVGDLAEKNGVSQKDKDAAAGVMLDYYRYEQENDEKNLNTEKSRLKKLLKTDEEGLNEISRRLRTAETQVFNVEVFSEGEITNRDILLWGESELLREEMYHDMELMLFRIRMVEGDPQPDMLCLLLYNEALECVVSVAGTLGEEELMKIADGMELVETDVPAYQRNDWAWTLPGVGVLG
ncbi:MAG: hypothetical protein MJ141_06420, partial [Clostridia bacterium]|nr:hypothetical protein [Clostridia bacterium]